MYLGILYKAVGTGDTGGPHILEELEAKPPQIFGPSTGSDIMHTALIFQPLKKGKQIIPFLLIFCDRSLCLVKVKTLSVYVIS